MEQILNKITPVTQQVLVQIKEQPTRATGLLIPDSVKFKQKPIEGVVIKCGTECSVKEGDTVLFYKVRAQEIEICEPGYYLLFEKDIFLSTQK